MHKSDDPEDCRYCRSSYAHIVHDPRNPHRALALVGCRRRRGVFMTSNLICERYVARRWLWLYKLWVDLRLSFFDTQGC